MWIRSISTAITPKGDTYICLSTSQKEMDMDTQSVTPTITIPKGMCLFVCENSSKGDGDGYEVGPQPPLATKVLCMFVHEHNSEGDIDGCEKS